jgi:dTDP-L-rhamnose 4-epimerase
MSELVLVTGGAGFIGLSVARRLLDCGYQVRILDSFSPQIHASNILAPDIVSKVELVEADIRDSKAVSKALEGVNVVLHLAAETGTGQSMYELEKYYGVNVHGTAVLLESIQEANRKSKTVRTVVVASSRAIYGEGAYICAKDGVIFPGARDEERMKNGRYDPLCPHCGADITSVLTKENASISPNSIYGLTKLGQEQACVLWGKSNGVNVFSLRYQNVYGPGQSLKNPYTGILAVFSNLARQGRDIEVYEDGAQTRDFVYIDDVVEATVNAADYKANYAGSLNVGSGIGTSVLSIAERICAYFDTDSQVRVSRAFRTGDIRHNAADVTLIEGLFGERKKVQFDKGLRSFLKWAEGEKLVNGTGYDDSVTELLGSGMMWKPREGNR